MRLPIIILLIGLALGSAIFSLLGRSGLLPLLRFFRRSDGIERI
jgi:hypothetical protein